MLLTNYLWATLVIVQQPPGHSQQLLFNGAATNAAKALALPSQEHFGAGFSWRTALTVDNQQQYNFIGGSQGLGQALPE